MSMMVRYIDEMDDFRQNWKIVAKIEHAYSVTTSIFAYGFQQKIWNKLFNL